MRKCLLRNAMQKKREFEIENAKCHVKKQELEWNVGPLPSH